jgi:hypothetical protein
LPCDEVLYQGIQVIQHLIDVKRRCAGTGAEPLLCHCSADKAGRSWPVLLRPVQGCFVMKSPIRGGSTFYVRRSLVRIILSVTWRVRISLA